VIAKFVVNNKIHSATKVSQFIANYVRKLKREADIKRKEKVKKVMEFVEKIKKVQKEIRTILRKIQKEMK